MCIYCYTLRTLHLLIPSVVFMLVYLHCRSAETYHRHLAWCLFSWWHIFCDFFFFFSLFLLWLHIELLNEALKPITDTISFRTTLVRSGVGCCFFWLGSWCIHFVFCFVVCYILFKNYFLVPFFFFLVPWMHNCQISTASTNWCSCWFSSHFCSFSFRRIALLMLHVCYATSGMDK